MRGTELRHARERLGATRQQIAELARVRTEEVADWENHGEIPRKHRYAVEIALWELERDEVIRQAGGPECSWMKEAEARPWEHDAEAVAQHLGSCPICTARADYVQAHLRPIPIGGSPTMRVFAIVERLSGWQRSAFTGAALLLGMAGIGVPVLLVLGIVQREPELIGGAVALLVLLAVSGAAGGIAHHLTARLRAKGALGYYASWVLTLYGYLFAVAGLLWVGVQVLGAEVVGDDIKLLLKPGGWLILLVLGAFFGILVGRSVRDRPADAAPDPQRKWLSLRNVAFALALLPVGAYLLVRLAGPSTPADFEAALPELRAAAAASPEDPDVQEELGLALLALERWGEAEEALERAARLGPGDPHLLNQLAWTRIQQSEFPEAIPTLQRALQLDPEHPHALHNLAFALFQDGRYAEAEVAYRKALPLTDNPAGAHGERGWVLIELRRLDQAVESFREAIRLEPAHPWYHWGLALALMQAGHPRDALASFREAVRLAPDDPRIRLDRGHLLHIMGDYAAATREYEAAHRLAPEIFDEIPAAREIWEASREGRPATP